MAEKKFLVKRGARSLKRAMAPVCRARGCAHAPVDRLGYCESCLGAYNAQRELFALLAKRSWRRSPRLFAALEREQAKALSEHAAGNALIGRPQIGWAISDMFAEAHETALRRLAHVHRHGGRRRPALVVIDGGRS